MKTKIEIVSEWKDDLIWCPSECYLQMTFEGRYFLLYLRWRHNDPWDATLIECDGDFYMHNKKYKWVILEVEHWKDTQIDEIKANAIEVAKKMIYNIIEV